MERYVLIGVCGFAIDIKGEASAFGFRDRHIEHGYLTVSFFLFGPFDVWVNAVDECEKRCNVVFVDGCDGVVRFP